MKTLTWNEGEQRHQNCFYLLPIDLTQSQTSSATFFFSSGQPTCWSTNYVWWLLRCFFGGGILFHFFGRYFCIPYIYIYFFVCQSRYFPPVWLIYRFLILWSVYLWFAMYILVCSSLHILRKKKSSTNGSKFARFSCSWTKWSGVGMECSVKMCVCPVHSRWRFKKKKKLPKWSLLFHLVLLFFFSLERDSNESLPVSASIFTLYSY